ncbi:MAG: DUF4338 domain-containing protein [Gammaproteobacteria bacterium]|nr:DUF4338 domain-containing protein [Gammaproteobacteria bacterium]
MGPDKSLTTGVRNARLEKAGSGTQGHVLLGRAAARAPGRSDRVAGTHPNPEEIQDYDYRCHCKPRSASHCQLPRPRFTLISTPSDSRLWNECIERCHYLDYRRLPGAQLHWFATINGQIVVALGFGVATQKTAPRDHYIDWHPEQRTLYR